MPFVKEDELPKMELFPGILGGIIAGDNLMLSFLEMEEGCEVPEHSHPHEQAGLVLEGKFRFRIGTEERLTGPGDAFIIPPKVAHWGIVALSCKHRTLKGHPSRMVYSSQGVLFEDGTTRASYDVILDEGG